MADAPAQPLPRHPPGLVDRRGPRACRARPGRGRGVGRRGARPLRGRRGGQHRRRGAPRGGRRRAAACASPRRRRAASGGSSRPAPSVRVAEAADGFTLENEHLRAVLGRDGTLRSLVELASGREAMAAPGNVLELYEDRPTAFEAWDLDPFHLETRTRLPARPRAPRSRSPTRCAPRSRSSARSAERSHMRQTVRLDAESPRLEFHCAIDWHEDRRALKVRFPVAVHAPRATYEMQFGVVERPTHYSTAPRPRPVRGPRPPLRRPLRARLRRRAAVGGDLRLVRPRRATCA